MSRRPHAVPTRKALAGATGAPSGYGRRASGPTFRDFKLSDSEMLWLSEAFEQVPFDARIALARLHDRLPEDFDPSAIDPRLYSNGRVTLLGLWFVDPHAEIFALIDRVARWIRDRILATPGVAEVSAAEIAQGLEAAEDEVAVALSRLCEFGRFFSTASGRSDRGYTSIGLGTDDVYRSYLSFPGIEAVLERRFNETAAVPGLALSAERHGGGAEDGDSPRRSVKPATAFVLMAMSANDPSLVDVHDAIKAGFAAFGVKAHRADEIEHQGRITDRILDEIVTCEYVLADLTHTRPNVYYEIGYAHARGVHPILVRRKGTPVHFDLSVHNVPEYTTVRDLREILERRLAAMTGRKPRRRS